MRYFFKCESDCSKLFLFTCLIIISFEIHSQKYTSYTTENGLPSNTVYDIKQDFEGNIWFATNRGVVKYDGSHFKIFSLKDGLPNNDVWYLETDKTGKVWYFTNSKFQGYIQNDSVYKFSTEDKRIISPIQCFKIGNEVIYSDKYHYHLVNNSLKIIRGKKTIDNFTSYIEKQSPNETVLSIWPRKNENYFTTVSKNRIRIYGEKLNHEIFTFDLNTVTKDKPINFIRSGSLTDRVHYWVLTSGILLFNIQKVKFRFHEFDSIASKSTITFNTEHRGKFQFSIGNQFFSFDENLENTIDITLPNTIKSFEDSYGNIWSTNLSSGVSFRSKNELQSKSFLIGEKVESLGFLDNRLFAGVHGKGAFEFEGKSNEELLFNYYAGRAYSIGNIPSLHQQYAIFANGYFTVSEGNFILNGGKSRHSELNRFKSILKFKNQIYTSDHRGLIRFNSKSFKKDLSIASIGLCQLGEFQNELFVAASDGLKVFKNNSLVHPSAISITKIPVNYFIRHRNYLAVATNGDGVYFYQNEKVKWIKSTTRLMVEKIVFQNDYMWLATNRGVKKIKIQWNDVANSKIVDAFNSSDGLIEDNINDMLFKNNMLYVATDNGVSKINPKSGAFQKKPNLGFNATKDTLISKKGKNISVSFSVLDFTNQKNFTYHYRLLPGQESWTSTSTQTLNFASLAAGEYTLEVRATDHHFNSSSKKLFIQILPAWWENWVSTLGLIVLLGLIAGFIYKLVQSRKLKRLVSKKNIEQSIINLELQALRTQMNPHFIHNLLNSLQYLILKNDMEESEKYVQRFSKHIRFYFDYASEKQISIREEIDLINNYLELEKLRFEEKFNYSIEIDDQINIDEAKIPTMVLQPIVENAINHGIFHNPKKGWIEIRFMFINESTYSVTIIDNGVGISESKILELNMGIKKHSTSIIHDRLNLLKLSKEWEINYSVDSIAEGKDNSGTTIKLTFKKIQV